MINLVLTANARNFDAFLIKTKGNKSLLDNDLLGILNYFWLLAISPGNMSRTYPTSTNQQSSPKFWGLGMPVDTTVVEGVGGSPKMIMEQVSCLANWVVTSWVTNPSDVVRLRI